ncbi:MAG TPA: hypothetical protein DCE03_00935 [Synergistaceae bacterium]|nr:hypothetical protein [Synergistaceae bacterium]
MSGRESPGEDLLCGARLGANVPGKFCLFLEADRNRKSEENRGSVFEVRGVYSRVAISSPEVRNCWTKGVTLRNVDKG